MRARLALLTFVTAICLSAALLFAVQPMVSRMLLPYYGGSASVWSVALVFFQAALLLGYLYAMLVIRLLPGRGGVAFHLVVLLSGLAVLPAMVSPAGSAVAPEWGVLTTLAAAIGLPFVALSANAPLLQAWFARTGLPGAHDPYPLYAASNAGSLIALVAYPFVLEPWIGLSEQSHLWRLGYVAFGALLAAIALIPQAALPGTSNQQPALRWSAVAFWVAMAAVPSMGLVAVTAHISNNIAAAPFLWVVPLALYLASFVVAFAGRAAGSAGVWRGLAVTTGAVAAATPWLLDGHFVADAMVQLLAFFLISVACHMRLVGSRPPPEQLTKFYLAMSFGGLCGGIFSAIVAPAAFTTVAEYQLFLAVAALACAGWRAGVVPAIVLAAVAVMPPASTVASLRSFYGLHTISDTPDGLYRILRNGREIHGAQRIRQQPNGPVQPLPAPLTYYHEQGPLSEAIDVVRSARGGGAISVGVVGLGAGSMACLVEAEDKLVFFEIDPAVVRIAREWFTFLRECHPSAPVVLGDARVSLQQPADAQFDLLVIDAFSGDAIPTHLLTREAMAIYMQRLKPDGVLVLHVSNNHLNLNEVVAATARNVGLSVRLFDEDEPAVAGSYIYAPTVVAVARSEQLLAQLFPSDEWITPPATATRPWTDDYANVLGALRSKLREN